MASFYSLYIINGLCRPNRSVRLAVGEGMADNQGRVTDPLVKTMVQLARHQRTPR